MKKLISFAAFALLASTIAFSLTACGDDDDEKGGNLPSGSGKYAEQIKGRWLMTLTRMSANAEWDLELKNDDKANWYEVRFDGEKYTYYQKYDAIAQADYKVEGDKINLYVGGNFKESWKILSLKDGALELLVEKNGKTYYYTYYQMPSTEEEARQIVLGQWGRFLNNYPYLDAYNMEFNKDGHFYYVQKIKADASNGYWYSDYKGQTIAYTYSYDYYSLIPDVNDPSRGVIFVYNNNQDDYNSTIPYKFLTKKTIAFWGELMTRQEDLKYVIID